MSPLYLANEDISLFEARLPAGVVRYELQAAASCGRPPRAVFPHFEVNSRGYLILLREADLAWSSNKCRVSGSNNTAHYVIL